MTTILAVQRKVRYVTYQLGFHHVDALTLGRHLLLTSAVAQ